MRKLIPVLFFLCPLLLLFSGFFHPITAFTQDLGRHILLGKIILQTKTVPNTNLFSYTYPDFPFVNHHFLSEVIFYGIDRYFGIPGFFVITLITIFITCGLVYAFALRYKHPLFTAFLALIYLRVLFERTDVRPELFSFLFLSLFVVILFLYKEKPTKLIFLLIPIQLVWVNTHIYFPLGILLLVLFSLDHLIQERKKVKSKKTLILFSVLIVASLVVFINPNGITGAFYPLRVFDNYGYAIEENQTIFFLEKLFYKPTIMYFKLAIATLFICLFLTIKKTRPIDWLLAITFTILGAQAVRNLPLFVITTFIPLVYAGQYIVRFLKNTYPIYKTQRALWIVFICLLLGTGWHIKDITEQKGFGYGKVTGAENATLFYKQQNIKGPVFNNFDIGSYFLSVMYPAQKVFVDGRPEAYPKDFFQKIYIPMQENEAVFSRVDQQYKFNSIFFSHTDQTPWAEAFLKTISTNPDWIPVYLDDTVIIFIKNNQTNKAIAKTFGMTKETLLPTNSNRTDISSLLKLVRLYTITQLPKQQITIYKQILTLDPTHCLSLYNLASIYTQSQNPAAQIYAQKYYRLCR